MPFLIQVNNPTYCKILQQECDTIEDLLEDVILLDSEYCIMFWNYTAIPLCYKYDISILFYDVIFMIDALSVSTKGCLDIHWPSNTFSARWSLIWDHNELTVSSQWHSVIGDVENVLNSKNKIYIKKSSFLDEWEKLINKIITIIQDLQYAHKKSFLTKLYDTKTKLLLNKKNNPLP